MDVINKLYSSVTSTVSQLSSVLPGNPVTREFEATYHIASAGPGLQWRIYKGFKKSTKQEVSIFVFEKRSLERWNKGDREAMLETLRRGVTQLTKLRHPQLLTLQHPLEESRESLAFATEPVFASLANILGKTDNLPQPLPTHLTNYKLLEIEIKYGLMQVAEGLAFLHSDAKLLHKNICPESIVINQQGAWKIFGFDFCALNQNVQSPEPVWPFVEYCQAMHPLTQPNIEFIAPECILMASHSPASDIFSLGMLIYCLHSPGNVPLGNYQDNFTKCKKFLSSLKTLPTSKFSVINEGLREYVKLMLNVTPSLRPDPHQFIKIPYFEDVGVKTLNYVDSLFQWDNLQKSQFFKGLPQIIQKLPHRVCIYRILPCLVKEFVNIPMVPFVLPNVLLIAENSTKEEFIKHILPSLKGVMTIQDPIQILLIFMQKMELLLKFTPAEEIKTDVLPMLYRALESDAQQIQELCLTVIPTFASLIDFPAMKNALLPRIKKLCISTNYLSVRVNCLLCLGKLLEHLDKWLVLDEVLPLLSMIPSREPAVLMGILGVYKLAMSHKKLGITKEVMATKVLPFLIPLCIENGLTLNQFNALMSLVKDMISKVESEHRAKLEQLNSIQQDSKQFEANLAATIGPLVPSSAPQTGDMFSGLAMESVNKDAEEKTNNSFNNITNGTQSLSIQDKQRLAQQQETYQRYKQQQVSTPLQPKLSMPTSPKPVDLTSNLMQSNIKQMTTPQKPVQGNLMSPQSNQFGMFSSPSSQGNQQNSLMSLQPAAMGGFMSPQSSQFNNMMLTSPTNQYSNNQMNSLMSPQSNVSNNSMMSNNFNMNQGANWSGGMLQNSQWASNSQSPSMNFSNESQSKQTLLTQNQNTPKNNNWSSLDTLISSQMNPQKKSPTQQPLLSSSANQSPNNDIMDLLG